MYLKNARILLKYGCIFVIHMILSSVLQFVLWYCCFRLTFLRVMVCVV